MEPSLADLRQLLSQMPHLTGLKRLEPDLDARLLHPRSVHEQVEVHLLHCRSHELASNFARARECVDAAISLAENENLPALQALALTEKVRLAWRTNEWQAGMDLAQRALAMAGDSPESIAVHRYRGLICHELGDVDEAEASFLRSDQLARLHGRPGQRAEALNGLANLVYASRGQFAQALALSRQVLALYREQGLAEWPAHGFQTWLHWTTGQLGAARAALAEYQKTYERDTFSDGSYHLFEAVLADEEGARGTFDAAIARASHMADVTGSGYLQIMIRLVQGSRERHAGRLPAALAWTNDAVARLKVGGTHQVAASLHVELALCKLQIGDARGARADAQSAANAAHLAHDAHIGTLAVMTRCFADALMDAPAAEQELQAAVTSFEAHAPLHWFAREASVVRMVRDKLPANGATARLFDALLARLPPQPLFVRGINMFEVRVGRRAIPAVEWTRRKAGVLLRFLLLQPGCVASRDSIQDALWPEASSEASAGLLHKATSQLRRALEPDLPEKAQSRYLISTDVGIQLLLPSGSRADFIEARTSPELHLLGGRPELFADDRFEQWCAAAREEMVTLWRTVGLARARADLNAGLAAEARTRAQSLLAADAWDEAAALVAMQAAVAQDDRQGALKVFDVLSTSLSRELKLVPSAELVALARDLRSAGSVQVRVAELPLTADRDARTLSFRGWPDGAARAARLAAPASGTSLSIHDAVDVCAAEFMAHERNGDFQTAEKVARAILELGNLHGQQEAVGAGHAIIASVMYRQSRMDDALRHANASLDAQPSVRWEASAHTLLGIIKSEVKPVDLHSAARHFQKAIEVARSGGWVLNHAQALNFMGQVIHGKRGELDQMVAYCQKARDLMRSLSLPYGGWHWVSAHVTWLRGERTALETTLDEIDREIAPVMPIHHYTSKYFRALLAIEDGHFEAAETAINEIRDQAETHGNADAAQWWRAGRIELDMARGNLGRALGWARDLVTAGEQLGSSDMLVAGHIYTARLAFKLNEAERCTAALDAADVIARQLDNLLIRTHVRMLRARLVGLTDVAEGAQALAAAQSRAHSLGLQWLERHCT